MKWWVTWSNPWALHCPLSSSIWAWAETSCSWWASSITNGYERYCLRQIHSYALIALGAEGSRELLTALMRCLSPQCSLASKKKRCRRTFSWLISLGLKVLISAQFSESYELIDLQRWYYLRQYYQGCIDSKSNHQGQLDSKSGLLVVAVD